MRDVLHTTVINRAGSAKHFGYLGAHGRTLEANEQYTHPGNLLDDLAAKPRQHAALLRDIDAGVLAVMNTPAPVLWDSVRDEAKVLTLTDGELGTADSELFGAYSSSEG